MSKFQQKTIHHVKHLENLKLNEKKTQKHKTTVAISMTEMSELSDKQFKVVIIKMNAQKSTQFKYGQRTKYRQRC